MSFMAGLKKKYFQPQMNDNKTNSSFDIHKANSSFQSMSNTGMSIKMLQTGQNSHMRQSSVEIPEVE